MEMNLVQHAGLPFRGIPAAGLHGVGIRRLPANLLQLMKGVSASRRILAEFKPEVLLFTGGYVAVPMALAGRKIPSLLYVPDIEPGLALKTLSRYASTIALTVEESKQYFNPKKHVAVTGYPTRPDLVNWNHADAFNKMGCKPELPVLLVLGGSKGARSINRALFPALPNLLDRCQVLHISGELDHEEAVAVQNGLKELHRQNYHLFPYMHEEIGAAFTIADLVVSRAGASILGEYPLFGLPSILVPYPYAWRYQKVNAQYLVDRGAALLVKNEDLQRGLLPTITRLLSNQGELQKMAAAVKTLASTNAASKIADLVRNLAKSKEAKHG